MDESSSLSLWVNRFYRKLIPYELRYMLYKFRRPREFRELRQGIYPSEKGDFSLKPFDQYKCIFVHITKSAGTSVAKSLLGYLPSHYTATQYRVIFGRRQFEKYFKFAYVRNPWDRLYSAYCYLIGGGWNQQDKTWAKKHLSSVVDFNDFVLNWLSPERVYSHIHFWPQHRFVCDSKGYILLDYLAYFETIHQDFDAIAEKIGVQAKLGHENASNRQSYKSVYSADAINKVASIYQTDIDMFGYDFNGIKKRKVV